MQEAASAGDVKQIQGLFDKGPDIFIFHSNFSDQDQMIHFPKNLAITGGVLYITPSGPGPISMDEKLEEGGDDSQ